MPKDKLIEKIKDDLAKSYKLGIGFNRSIGIHSIDDLTNLLVHGAAIVGMGCDGCEVAEQLVRTGIDHLTLIDGDIVEESNLNRQRLYAYSDITVPKVFAAQRRLQDIDPDITISAVNDYLTYKNGEEYLRGHDVIVQGLDSITARIMAHEIAKELKIPIVSMSGQPPYRSCVSTFLPDSPTYQDHFGIELEKPVREMSKKERTELDFELCKERAKHAFEHGADGFWYEKFLQGEAGWSITLGRSAVTGTLQSNQVIRYLTGKGDKLVIAPKMYVHDQNGLKEFGFPNDICKILEPLNGKSWDYRMF